MSIRHMFVTMTAVMLASAVFADNSNVTSKKYVDDFMAEYQDKIPGSGNNKLMIYDESPDGIGEKNIVSSLGESTSATDVPNVGAIKAGMDGKQDTINGTAGYVMTGMGTNRPGEVGERAIYSTSLYGDSLVTPQTLSSALVTAETVNSGVINAVNNSLRRVNENGELDNNGTLWEIADDLTALNICSNYTTATGTSVQNGTPTPTNPIMPNFYEQGDMILRRVGTYADSYDVNTNKITRRVGIKVLDGTENWKRGTNSIYADGLFPDTIAYSANNPAIFCSHFKGFQPNVTLSNIPDLSAKLGTSSNQKRMYFIYDAITTAEQFMQFLSDQYAAGTPVVVYYPLATPVTEDMPPRCQ